MTDTSLSPARRATGRAYRFSLLDGLLTMVRLARSRQDLSRLDSRMLEDIGVTRKQADAECSRPAWDVPAHWLQ